MHEICAILEVLSTLASNDSFGLLRPRLHEQIKPFLVAQILDPYEVTTENLSK